MNRPAPAELCGDDELGYERSRTRLQPGEPLRMDELYRYAHLPLIAPDHPAMIPANPGKGYRMGRHAMSTSLVMPVTADVLGQSEAYQAIERQLRASSFGRKIAWDLLERRQFKLHATICGSLPAGPSPVAEAAFAALSRLGPIRVQLRGLFSGNMNVGRLYLRAYPERRDGENVFHRIQNIMGRPLTGLYLIGLFNLLDDLDASEASELLRMLQDWWDVEIADLVVSELRVLRATDDLVLDSEIVTSVPLHSE